MIFVVEEHCVGKDSYIVEAKNQSEARSKFLSGDFQVFSRHTEILEHNKVEVRKPTAPEQEDKLFIQAVSRIGVENKPANYSGKKRGRPKK